MLVTSDYWRLSENLLNFILPGIILFSCVVGFILFGLLSSNIKKKIIICSMSGVLLINLLVIGVVFKVTTEYRALSQFQTSKNREVKASLFRYENNKSQKNNSYSLKDVEITKELPFYEISETTVENELTYLGKDEHLYFFEKDKKLYNVDIANELVGFNSENTTVEMRQETAILKDESFKMNHFKTKVGPVIVKIIIPANMTDIEYRPNIPTNKLLE